MLDTASSSQSDLTRLTRIHSACPLPSDSVLNFTTNVNERFYAILERLRTRGVGIAEASRWRYMPLVHEPLILTLSLWQYVRRNNQASASQPLVHGKFLPILLYFITKGLSSLKTAGGMVMLFMTNTSLCSSVCTQHERYVQDFYMYILHNFNTSKYRIWTF
jgi:hypothetical protein